QPAQGRILWVGDPEQPSYDGRARRTMSLAPHQDAALDGTTPLRVGVVVPRRGLAWVRVLHEARSEHHPAAILTVLVLDGVSEGEPFAQVTPDDVLADSGRWHRL